jgi:hypothetical protein
MAKPYRKYTDYTERKDTDYNQFYRLEFNKTNYLLDAFLAMFKPRREPGTQIPIEFYNYDDPINLEIVDEWFTVRLCKYINGKEYSYKIKKNIRTPCDWNLIDLKGTKIHCSFETFLEFITKKVAAFAEEEKNGLDYNDFVQFLNLEYTRYKRKKTEDFLRIEQEIRDLDAEKELLDELITSVEKNA